MAAVEALMPIAFAGFHRGMLSFTKAPITMDVTERRVTFSGPESSVDMDVMKGFGGKPVKISNLPNPAFQDYTQYRSVSHTHTSAQPHVHPQGHERLHVDDGRGEQVARSVSSRLSHRRSAVRSRPAAIRRR